MCTIGSSETNEIVSFGGGDNFQMRQRDYLVWGWGEWRIFSSKTNELISFGGGVGVENILI